MAETKIQLQGFKELETKLKEFGAKVAKNGLRASNFAGAKVIKEAVKENIRSGGQVHVITGTLLEAISVFRRRSPENVAQHSIGIRRLIRKYANTAQNRRKRRAGKRFSIDSPAFYGKFLELGTSKMRPHPFMRPAFESNVDLAIRAIKTKLAAVVEREAKKRR